MAEYPYTHTWAEDGIERQAQIHLAETGSEVVFAPTQARDGFPWQDLDDQDRRYSDDQITSLTT